MRWPLSTRLAFRLAFAFFGLYFVASHLLVYLFVPPNTLPGQGFGTLWPLSEVTSWTAVHVFGITEPLVYTGNSRDTNFFWVQLFVVLIIAIVAAAVWSLLDRRRENYATLYQVVPAFHALCDRGPDDLFRDGQSHSDASFLPVPPDAGRAGRQSFASGTAVDLHRSIRAVPDFHRRCRSHWRACCSLFREQPRLGAILSLISMSHVFVLNMTYDVGVKILSFQLALMSLVLLMPELPRLTKALASGRAPIVPNASLQSDLANRPDHRRALSRGGVCRFELVVFV